MAREILNWPGRCLSNAEAVTWGADPQVFRGPDGLYYMVIQQDINPDPNAHQGPSGIAIREASSVARLANVTGTQIHTIGEQNGTHVWAPEICRVGGTGRNGADYCMYVAESRNGINSTHEPRVYRTLGDAYGPWVCTGGLMQPKEQKCWAIDHTIVEIGGNARIQSNLRKV